MYKQYATVLPPEKGGTCTNVNIDGTMCVISSVYKTDKVVQHRIRPVELWSSPTSLGPFSTVVTNHIIERVYEYTSPKNYWFLCGNPQRVTPCSWFNRAFSREPLPPDNVWSGTIPQWENELAARVKEMRVNLAGNIAEYQETIGVFSETAAYLARVARETRNCVRGLRRGKVSRSCDKIFVKPRRGQPLRVQDLPKTLASANLGASFALGPNLGIVFDSLVALQDKVSNTLHLRKVSFKMRESTTRNRPLWNGYLPVEGSYTVHEDVRVKVWVQMKPTAGSFTPGNPAEMIWEMIPFSFVLDWMIGVGDYLSALDAYEGVERIVGTVTQRTIGELSGVQRRDAYGPCGPTLRTQSAGSAMYKRYHRQVIARPPALKIPGYEPSSSYRSLLNAVSLLTVLRAGANKSF